MTRLLAALPVRPADPDRVLLARFAASRDDPAFVELLRRHGPMVWGVCRRQLANPADAEDAFQAAFLVLARRADAVPGCVGAWLHRVAVLTCRNVRRANRRRPAVALPSDIPVSPPADRVEVDDLLNRLPERDRRAVVLCHLLGFTRTEAAKQLGVPEGTLSARLSRGLARLRGTEALTLVAVPAALSAATARAVGVWEATAVGLSPAATGAATGVLRMFWVKKMTAVTAVVLAGLTTAGVGTVLTAGPAESPAAATLPDGWKLEVPVAGRQPDGPTSRLTAVVQRGWVVVKLDAPDGRREWEVVLGRAVAAPTATVDPATRRVNVELGKYFIREAFGQLRVLRERKPDGPPTWEPLRVPGPSVGRSSDERLFTRVSDGWLWVVGGPPVKPVAAGQPWWPDDTDRADFCVRLAPNDATVLETSPHSAVTHTVKLRPSVAPDLLRPRPDNVIEANFRAFADHQAGWQRTRPSDDTYWLADDNRELLTANRYPVAAPPPAARPAAGWNQSAELKTDDGTVLGKLTTRVEKGWLVARYDAPVGRKVWEVALAPAEDHADLPEVSADLKSATVAVQYGRYFVRDAAGRSLRVLRKPKGRGGMPVWLAPEPGEPTRLGGAAGGTAGAVALRHGREWLWVSAGPMLRGNPADPAKPELELADLCLRLDHTGHDGGASGTGRMTNLRGGVNSVDHGDTKATDDGELFVADYRSDPPAPPGNPAPPAPPKPAAPPPAKPTPPAADLSQLPEDARKLFEELVPVCVTGTVRDADGNPIPNAKVQRENTVGSATFFAQTDYTGQARTDAAGRYTIWFRTHPDTTVVVTGLVASADGFVPHRQAFSTYDELKAHPDRPGEWDIVLAKGELLAGTVPAAVGKERVPLLVRGPSFERIERLEDGKFKLWVPAGKYTLTAVLEEQRTRRDSRLPEEARYAYGQVITKSAVLRDVASGSDGLVVK